MIRTPSKKPMSTKIEYIENDQEKRLTTELHFGTSPGDDETDL